MTLAALLLLILLAIGGSARSAHAAGYIRRYCSLLVEPLTRCPNAPGGDHTWNWNDAYGMRGGITDGSYPKCELMLDTAGGQLSRNCKDTFRILGRWDDYCGNCHSYENSDVLGRVYVGNSWPFYGKILYGLAEA